MTIFFPDISGFQAGIDLKGALAAAGVITDDLSTIARIVIDAKAGQPVRLHIERYGDERLLNVAATLEGVKIVREQP